MKLLILTIVISSSVSFAISHWYLKQMTNRTEQWLNNFFEQYRNEYKSFLDEMKKR